MYVNLYTHTHTHTFPRADELEKVLGETSPALQQIKDLFTYAEAYGFKDWLVFDASVVRGLAYYTGLVFEGFDRQVIPFPPPHFPFCFFWFCSSSTPQLFVVSPITQALFSRVSIGRSFHFPLPRLCFLRHFERKTAVRGPTYFTDLVYEGFHRVFFFFGFGCGFAFYTRSCVQSV